MSNVITRTFIGTTATATVVNKVTMAIENITVYVDGAHTLGKDLDKAIVKELGDNYTFVVTLSADKCNKTLEMPVSDFMKYAKEIETRDVKGFRERTPKATEKKTSKKNN